MLFSKRDNPASMPTRDILSDIGTLIRFANMKIIVDTNNADARNSIEPLGNRIFIVFVIVEPWSRRPVEKPIAVRNILKRLLITLDPTAEPTQTERLFPETSITATKVKATRKTEKSIIYHLRTDVMTVTIKSERSSQVSRTKSSFFINPL